MDFKLTKDNIRAAFDKHAPGHARSQMPDTVVDDCCKEASGVLCCGQPKGKER